MYIGKLFHLKKNKRLKCGSKLTWTGTRVVIEVPDGNDYRGRLEGLCGNMDGDVEQMMVTWDEYAEKWAEGTCSGSTKPLPEPCKAVSWVSGKFAFNRFYY